MAIKKEWQERLKEWGFTQTDSPMFPFEKALSEEDPGPEEDKLCFVVDMSRHGAICLRTGFGDSLEFGGIETKEELLTIERCLTGSFPNW